MVIDKEKENESELTLEAVRAFLLQHDGKVKQSQLVNHFRTALTTPSTRGQAREDFKNILQLITATKTENGDKYIVLIKQSQDNYQNSVITRKANRPLSARKELARSKNDFLTAPFASRAYESGDDDTMQCVVSSLSQESTGNAVEVESIQSLRDVLPLTINDSKSVDSINTICTEGSDDLEDEIDLGVEILPEEKEWFLASSTGEISTLKKLLEMHPKLARNRDFVFGYTALHWAAKLGRADIVNLVVENGVDVQSKSHGGYTPLHVAAMSGKDQVITQLIELHGANIHSRDHSGKKAKDLVKETVAADVQRKLGRSVILTPDWLLTDYNMRKASIVPRAISNVS